MKIEKIRKYVLVLFLVAPMYIAIATMWVETAEAIPWIMAGLADVFVGAALLFRYEKKRIEKQMSQM